MKDYLFHRLDYHGRSADSEILGFETDEAAIRHALGSPFPHGCELWDAYRLLGRFCRSSEPSTPSADRTRPAPSAVPEAQEAA